VTGYTILFVVLSDNEKDPFPRLSSHAFILKRRSTTADRQLAMGVVSFFCMLQFLFSMTGSVDPLFLAGYLPLLLLNF